MDTGSRVVVLPPLWLSGTARECGLPWLPGLPCTQVPLPRISCPPWPQHRQLCGSGQTERRQLFPVPRRRQDQDSRGRILKALSLISGGGEGKLGNGGDHPPPRLLQPCLTCRPPRAGLAFSVWTCVAPAPHDRGQGELAPVTQNPVPVPHGLPEVQ